MQIAIHLTEIGRVPGNMDNQIFVCFRVTLCSTQGICADDIVLHFHPAVFKIGCSPAELICENFLNFLFWISVLFFNFVCALKSQLTQMGA